MLLVTRPTYILYQIYNPSYVFARTLTIYHTSNHFIPLPFEKYDRLRNWDPQYKLLIRTLNDFLNILGCKHTHTHARTHAHTHTHTYTHTHTHTDSWDWLILMLTKCLILYLLFCFQSQAMEYCSNTLLSRLCEDLFYHQNRPTLPG